VSGRESSINSANTDNLDAEKDYGWSLNVYSNSKLMNVLFANELTRKWEVRSTLDREAFGSTRNAPS
jgi:hypothetical protein